VPPTEDEFTLLGLSLYAAQRVEFVLYGLAAHASHLTVAQSERRFRTLTPDDFLTPGAAELKATLGQLVKTFGDSFLVRTSDLDKFIDDRNLIAHNYVRTFHMTLRGVKPRLDGEDFLRDFISRATLWEKVLRGLLSELIVAAAKRENRLEEVSLTDSDIENVTDFRELASQYLQESGKLDAES
jgi:hypothetical protein